MTVFMVKNDVREYTSGFHVLILKNTFKTGT